MTVLLIKFVVVIVLRAIRVTPIPVHEHERIGHLLLLEIYTVGKSNETFFEEVLLTYERLSDFVQIVLVDV